MWVRATSAKMDSKAGRRRAFRWLHPYRPRHTPEGRFGTAALSSWIGKTPMAARSMEALSTVRRQADKYPKGPARSGLLPGFAITKEWSDRVSDYPEKTCTIDNLVRNAKLVRSTLSGEKTEQRRDGVYGYPGETFELEGETFEITSLTHDRLGDMGDAEARKEGFGDLEAYRSLIIRMHKGMSWDPDHLVWVHRFRRVTSEISAS